MTRRALASEVQAIVEGTHTNPHAFLGHHGRIVRVWRPEAESVLVGDVKAERIHPAGLFEAKVPDTLGAYLVHVEYPNGATFAYDDPYRHWPTLGDIDLHLIGEGRHERLWEILGAHCRVHEGVEGTAFAVWAPSARSVRVVGEFNLWDGRVHPMRQMGASGVWELFVPGVTLDARYKLEVVGADGSTRVKADPMAQRTEVPPGTASIVTRSTYEWGDAAWLARRREAAASGEEQRLTVYEVHLGSWRRVIEDGGRSLTYRELAEQLPDYVAELGFTHVELLPVAEHPYGGSWGYQVTSYYAPTARFGTPDDFRALVDALHQRGIGVIVDWVPAHFPKDDWALARFDGTALYEHADPRQGEQPDWGTLVFNYARNEVRNFLVANALYWVEVLHLDGIRVDAVASMLYLDYSRKAGEWVPNIHGGRENLAAIEFLRETNTTLLARCPGALSIAEESTAFPGVSRPVGDGGLGFTHKWNMGWMHDTLDYIKNDPVHRRYHHGELTFGFLYAFTERFVLPLSHDEVVHLKGSLLTKMPGDDWQRFANLRALYGWMWSHPGKQLLFMGCELAQREEWSEARSLDWHLLDAPLHAGVQQLISALNRVESVERALWACDFDSAGFQWLSADDADRSILAFVRHDPTGGARPVVVVANLTPVPRYGERVGLPRAGVWEELLNTDAEVFGGSGVGNGGVVETDDVAWHGQPQSAVLTLPPLGVLYLAPAEEPGVEGGGDAHGAMRLLLLAPPGAGKGTQGERLAERYGIAHLASGDLLRAEVAAGTELGKAAKADMDRGDLVPDDLVVAMMHAAVLGAPGGYVLDGFPRTLSQAEAAYTWAKDRDLTFDAVVHLDAPDSDLVERLLGRARLEGRADDDLATIRKRLVVYRRETAPLVDYYRGRGVLAEVDATGAPDEVAERVVQALAPFVPAR